MKPIIVAIIVVVVVACLTAGKKKETFVSDIVYPQPENRVTCPMCNEFGCMGPGKCQPSNTYFTAESNREKSRAVTIPAEDKMNATMAEYHKMKALQIQTANKQQTVDVLNQQLTGLAATTAFLNGGHEADVKLEQELAARDNAMVEKFSYGGPVIYGAPRQQTQLGLSPYISGRQ